MSITIKFTISEMQNDKLYLQASKCDLSIQDYIRKELFNDLKNITPEKAVKLALKKYSKEEKFTVQDLFKNDWNLPNGVAGQFGKKFSELVKSKYSEQIYFTGNFNIKKQAIYRIL